MYAGVYMYDDTVPYRQIEIFVLTDSGQSVKLNSNHIPAIE